MSANITQMVLRGLEEDRRTDGKETSASGGKVRSRAEEERVVSSWKSNASNLGEMIHVPSLAAAGVLVV